MASRRRYGKPVFGHTFPDGKRITLNSYYIRGNSAATEWRITLRDNDGEQIGDSRCFSSRPDADIVLDNLLRNGVRLTDFPSFQGVEYRLEDARLVIERKILPKVFPRTISLALAIDRVVRGDLSEGTEVSRSAVPKILGDLNNIPRKKKVIEIEQWAHACLHRFRNWNHHERRQHKVGVETLRHRIDFFRRALDRIENNPHGFGEWLSQNIRYAKAIISEQRFKSLKEAEPSVPYAPISVTDIHNTLDQILASSSVYFDDDNYLTAAEAVATALYFIKSLACGLRPSEVERLNTSHVVNGRIILRGGRSNVVTKIKNGRVQDSKTPLVSEVLQLILDLESQQYIPPPSLRWLKKYMPFDLYQLRTTLATNLCYCGIDHNGCAEYLGHDSSEMTLRRYSRQRPPGAENSPSDYYKTDVLEFKLNGNVYSVATTELLWFRFLLKVAMTVLQKLPGFNLDVAKNMILGYEQQIAVPMAFRDVI
jgi:integrase